MLFNLLTSQITWLPFILLYELLYVTIVHTLFVLKDE